MKVANILFSGGWLGGAWSFLFDNFFIIFSISTVIVLFIYYFDKKNKDKV